MVDARCCLGWSLTVVRWSTVSSTYCSSRKAYNDMASYHLRSYGSHHSAYAVEEADSSHEAYSQIGLAPLPSLRQLRMRRSSEGSPQTQWSQVGVAGKSYQIRHLGDTFCQLDNIFISAMHETITWSAIPPDIASSLAGSQTRLLVPPVSIHAQC